MKWCVFDIETGPLPDEHLQRVCPPWEPTPFNGGKEFDPSEVKVGNLKDQAKITQKILNAEAAFYAAKKKHDAEQADAKKSHFVNFKDEAALCVSTGCVLAIGMYSLQNESFYLMHEDGNEFCLLSEFWRQYKAAESSQVRMAGLNIFAFDLPFLIRRSWILNVNVPKSVCDFTTKWTNWSPVFVDLRKVWQLGDSQAKSNFDHISQCFETGGKHADMCGKDFATFWHTRREDAIKYLKQDVSQPAEWIRRMGLAEA